MTTEERDERIVEKAREYSKGDGSKIDAFIAGASWGAYLALLQRALNNIKEDDNE